MSELKGLPSYLLPFALLILIFLVVGYVFIENYDDNYVYNLVGAAVSIAALGMSLVYLFERLELGGKWGKRIMMFALCFVFWCGVYFWYADDYRVDYWSNILVYASMTTGGLVILGMLSLIFDR